MGKTQLGEHGSERLYDLKGHQHSITSCKYINSHKSVVQVAHNDGMSSTRPIHCTGLDRTIQFPFRPRHCQKGFPITRICTKNYENRRKRWKSGGWLNLGFSRWLHPLWRKRQGILRIRDSRYMQDALLGLQSLPNPQRRWSLQVPVVVYVSTNNPLQVINITMPNL